MRREAGQLQVRAQKAAKTVAVKEIVLQRPPAGLVGKCALVAMAEIPLRPVWIVNQQPISARIHEGRKDCDRGRSVLVPDFAPMAPMVQSQHAFELIGLSHPIEMVLRAQLIAQFIFPVGPGQSTLFDFFEQRPAIPGQVAQVKGIAAGLDYQVGAAQGHRPIVFNDLKARPRPILADDCMAVFGRLLVQSPVSGDPAMAHQIGSQRRQHQV